MKHLPLIYSIAIFIFLFCLISLGFYRYFDFQDNYIESKGVVVKQDLDANGDVFYYIKHFVNGKEYLFPSSADIRFKRPRLGDTVDIQYYLKDFESGLIKYK